MSLRQGNALSPVLFNLILEKIIREINGHNGIVWETQILTFWLMRMVL